MTSYIDAQLQKIEDLHQKPITEYNEMKNALISELEIYRDLVPGYKVKPTGGAGGAQHQGLKKKDVLAVERCEQLLLAHYERYLQLVMRICEKKHPESQALGSRCIAELLGFANNFNFNQHLIRTAVQLANSKHVNVSRPCLNALKDLFAVEGGAEEPTLLAVDAIIDIVKERQHALNPRLLFTLLHMRVRVVDVYNKKGGPDNDRSTSKAKRAKKEEDRVAKELQVKEGVSRKGESKATQTRLFQKVMTVYLRILEASRHCSELHQSLLLAPTLEGLAKYGHLMNMELHQLLMVALKDIIEDVAHTPITVALHALVTVAILTNHQDSIEGMAKNDLQQYHSALYRLLGESMDMPKEEKTTAPSRDDGADTDAEEGMMEELLPNSSSDADNASSAGGSTATSFSIARSMCERRSARTPSQEWVYRSRLAFMACDLMLVQVKRLPTPRIAAFVRRLGLYACATPSHIAAAAFRLLQKLCSQYPSVTGMIVGGHDNIIGSGEYLMGATSPDHANAQSAFMWELRALTRSTHPALRTMANQWLKEYSKAKKRSDLLAQVVGTHDELSPVQVLEKYDVSKGGFAPQPQPPKRSRSAMEKE